MYRMSIQVQQHEIKLLKLRVETFGGELATGQGFWECFKQPVHDNDGLAKLQKFQHLGLLLTGPVMAAIKGLQATEAYYGDDKAILQSICGDKERMQQEHLGKLRALSEYLHQLTYGFLELYSNESYSDRDQAFNAGIFEGYATADRAIMHYDNLWKQYCAHQVDSCVKLFQFIGATLNYMQQQATELAVKDPYWHQDGLNHEESA
ncbi:hypothetical protein HPB51_013358 [Rhipicephalus microplus]|uniref:Phospholipase B-like n=1 Tax=Rhipicephalus microplus TaxID=6941 RepID=A0A9J6EGA0_RHIMP|nr:hypothetical protein HPB51_013358 [Rhipicephalus microplus]